jgi:hypothetical protein
VRYISTVDVIQEVVTKRVGSDELLIDARYHAEVLIEPPIPELDF